MIADHSKILPNDLETLRASWLEQACELALLKAELAEKDRMLESRSDLIVRMKHELAQLKRSRYGRSSEKIEHRIEQLELALEELDLDDGKPAPEDVVLEAPSSEDAPAAEEPRKPKPRRSFPEKLKRTDVVHEPERDTCPECGGVMRKVGEDVSEILHYVPARFEVLRHIRPSFSCRCCEKMVQKSMPTLPIERSYASSALLSHILVSKFCDHLPLYRQNEIFAREEIEISHKTMAFWVGKCVGLLKPLAERIRAHVLSGETIHADDTPLPVLDKRFKKTREARLWVYLRDERPFSKDTQPAAYYAYSPDRKGEHPQTELAGWEGFLHADAYSGFNKLYEKTVLENDKAKARIHQVSCWAHARRKFYEIHASAKSKDAEAVLERMGEVFEIERDIAGRPPDERKAVRQERSVPKVADLKAFLEQIERKTSRKSPLGQAIHYMLVRWTSFARFTEDGRLELTNNAAERAIRPLALGRKNWLFAGSDNGGVRAAMMYTLLQTAKLNGVNPHAWLADVLERINDHPVNRLDDLLPWNWTTPAGAEV